MSDKELKDTITILKDGFLLRILKPNPKKPATPHIKRYLLVFNKKHNHEFVGRIIEHTKGKTGEKRKCFGSDLVDKYMTEDLWEKAIKNAVVYPFQRGRFTSKTLFRLYFLYGGEEKRVKNNRLREKIFWGYFFNVDKKEIEGKPSSKKKWIFWLGGYNKASIKYDLNRSVTEWDVDPPKGMEELGRNRRDDTTAQKPIGNRKTDETKTTNTTQHQVIRGIHAAPTAVGFVGRTKELQILGNAWESKQINLVSIVAWGGFGKSVLVKQWIDELKSSTPTIGRPQRGLWWSFYENDSIDAFLETALTVFTGDANAFSRLSYSETKFDTLIRTLSDINPGILILDGFEEMQHHESGDYFGKCRNYQLAHFIQRICENECPNLLCIITSRLEITDVKLFDNKTHLTIDLENAPLSSRDSTSLLKNHGVLGSDEELENIAQDHGGHPLSLVTVASLLSEFFKGDAKKMSEMPSVVYPEVEIGDRFKLWRIFSWYHLLLKSAEKRVLQTISVFRQRAPWKHLTLVLDEGSNKYIDAKIRSICSHLYQLRLINYDSELNSYSMHPLLKQFFMQTTPEKKALQLNESLFNLFQAEAEFQPTDLKEMAPLIEAVYHGCRCGKSIEALQVFRERIERKAGYLTKNLNAWGIKIDLCEMFFSGKRFTGKCYIEDLEQQGHLLNAAGFAHMNMGRPDKAVSLFKRSVDRYSEVALEIDAAQVYRNIADASIRLGELNEAVAAAKYSLERDPDQKSQQSGLGYLGYAYALLGDNDRASEIFKQALTIFGKDWLPPIRGIQYIEMLIMKRAFNEAINAAKKMKTFSEKQGIQFAIAESNRILGVAKGRKAITEKNKKLAKESISYLLNAKDLASSAGVHYYNYKTILDTGQMQVALANEKLILIDTSIARKIRNQVNDTLDIARASYYRLLEAEAYFIRAELCFFEKDNSGAREDCKRAINLSRYIGYKWLSAMCERLFEKKQINGTAS